jgi:chromosome segregation ATPase
MVLEKEKQRLGFIKEHKKAFVAPPRPFDELDEQIEETKYKLKKLKEELEELAGSSKKTKKYMPPGMRGKQEADDPVTRLAKMEVAIVENELTGLLNQLESSNKRWNEVAWLDAMLRDAAKRPSFLIGARAHTPSA